MDSTQIFFLFLIALQVVILLVVVVSARAKLVEKRKQAIEQRQREADARVEESLALARRSIELQEQAAVDTKEMIRLLRTLAGETESETGIKPESSNRRV